MLWTLIAAAAAVPHATVQAELVSRIAACVDPESEDGTADGLASSLRPYAHAGRLHHLDAQLLYVPLAYLAKQHIVALSVPSREGKEHGAVPAAEAPGTADNPHAWPDAVCFQHDYNLGPDAFPDPSGCALFRATFEPLQRLRACIVPKLQADALWPRHREAAVTKDGKLQQLVSDGERGAEFLTWCAANFPRCEDVDTLRRAEEIIHAFGVYQRWCGKEVGLDPCKTGAKMEHISNLKDRVGFSQSLQDGAKVSPATADAVAQCFHTQPTPLPQLHRAAQCLPLMYDAVALAADEPADVRAKRGVTDAIVKFNHPDHADNSRPRLSQRYRNTPPVCARAAMAMVGPHFDRGTASGGRQLRLGGLNFAKDCLHPSSHDPKDFHRCWEKALDHTCDLIGDCCPSATVPKVSGEAEFEEEIELVWPPRAEPREEPVHSPGVEAEEDVPEEEGEEEDPQSPSAFGRHAEEDSTGKETEEDVPVEEEEDPQSPSAEEDFPGKEDPQYPNAEGVLAAEDDSPEDGVDEESPQQLAAVAARAAAEAQAKRAEAARKRAELEALQHASYDERMARARAGHGHAPAAEASPVETPELPRPPPPPRVVPPPPPASPRPAAHLEEDAAKLVDLMDRGNGSPRIAETPLPPPIDTMTIQAAVPPPNVPPPPPPPLSASWAKTKAESGAKSNVKPNVLAVTRVLAAVKPNGGTVRRAPVEME